MIHKIKRSFWGIYEINYSISDDIYSPQVLIVVQSAPKNKLQRDEIRRTWGKSCVTTHNSWCYLIFILGHLT